MTFGPFHTPNTAPPSPGITGQMAALQRVVRTNAKSGYGQHIGLMQVQGSDMDALYAAWCRHVPLVTAAGLEEALRDLLGENAPAAPAAALSQVPGLLAAQPPVAFAPWRGLSLPLSKGVVAAGLDMESMVLKALAAHNPGVQHGTVFYLTEPEVRHSTAAGDVPALDWFSIMEQLRGKGLFASLRAPKVEPRFATLQNATGSRFQWFNDVYAALKKHGRNVRTLVAHPATLTDFCLFIAQQEGRFVPLQSLCPRLQGFVCAAELPDVQRAELSYLFKGLPNMRWLCAIAETSGLMLWQVDVNVRHHFALMASDQVFYEFIPLSGLHDNGTPRADAPRLHSGQLKAGETYAVVISHTGGVLGLHTGRLVQAQQTTPLRVLPLGPSRPLNGLGEQVWEHVLVSGVGNINRALANYNVFVREILLGHRVAERRHEWVIEVSQPPGDVAPELLQSMAERLVRDLEIPHPNYRQLRAQGKLQPARVTFVPVGTFHESWQGRRPFTVFDHSADAAQVRAITAHAWQPVVFEVA